MSEAKPIFGVSVVCSDVDASIAFYRTLGVPIPDDANWRSHHVGIPIDGSDLDLDSTELTKGYDGAWSGSGVILIMRVPSREAVDEAYRAWSMADIPGTSRPSTRSGVRATRWSAIPTATTSAS